MNLSKLRRNAIVATLLLVSWCQAFEWNGREFEEGWKPDPEAALQIAKSLPKVWFQQAKARGDESDESTVLLHLFLKEACEGQQDRNQGSEGSCVGQGTATAAETRSATEILYFGEPERFVRISADACYGLSRQIAGQLGRWQGSTGAWSAKALMEYGTLHHVDYGDGLNLSRESPRNAGRLRQTGFNARILEIARKHRMKSVVLVRTVQEARGLIQNGNPIFICSNVGFANGSGGRPTRRDEQGVAEPRGNWSHCMAVLSYRGDIDAYLVANSWGDSVSGPKGPYDISDAQFWIRSKVLQRILSQNDSWAVGGYQGFIRSPIKLKDLIAQSGGSYKKRRRDVELSIAP